MEKDRRDMIVIGVILGRETQAVSVNFSFPMQRVNVLDAMGHSLLGRL